MFDVSPPDKQQKLFTTKIWRKITVGYSKQVYTVLKSDHQKHGQYRRWSFFYKSRIAVTDHFFFGEVKVGMHKTGFFKVLKSLLATVPTLYEYKNSHPYEPTLLTDNSIA